MKNCDNSNEPPKWPQEMGNKRASNNCPSKKTVATGSITIFTGKGKHSKTQTAQNKTATQE